MSIFDGIGGMLGGLIEQFGGPQAILGDVLQQMGGVDGVLDKLRQAGLGDQVSSWLGEGENQPVSGDQLHQALGHGAMADIAAKVGVSPEQLSQMMAQFLPGVIDKMSSNGSLQQ